MYAGDPELGPHLPPPAAAGEGTPLLRVSRALSDNASRRRSVILPQWQLLALLAYAALVSLALVIMIATRSSNSSSRSSPSVAAEAGAAASIAGAMQASSSSQLAFALSSSTAASSSGEDSTSSGAGISSDVGDEDDDPRLNTGETNDSAFSSAGPLLPPRLRPFLNPASSPLAPPDPSSATMTSPEGGGDECSSSRDVRSAWNGAVAYDSRPYLPPHHFQSSLARFVQLTDIHLEHAFEHGSLQPESAQVGLCRRLHVESDSKDRRIVQAVDEVDWIHSQGGNDSSSARVQPMFPLGRLNCDPPHSLLESALHTLASFAEPDVGDKPHERATGALMQEDARLQSDESARSQRARALGALDVQRPRSSFLPGSTDRSRPPLDFVLLTGDLAAHLIENEQTHRAAIERVVQRSVRVLAPRVKGGAAAFVPSIGNTDLFPTFYIPQTHERIPFRPPATFDATAEFADDPAQQAGAQNASTPIDCHPTFHRLLSVFTASGLLPSRTAQEEFCRGGFFAHLVPHLRLRILSLNSILWSPSLLFNPAVGQEQSEGGVKDRSDKAAPERVAAAMAGLRGAQGLHVPTPCDDSQRQEDPYDQFTWLESQLRSATESGERVLLATHIPPGFKDQSDSPHALTPGGQMAWCPRYYDRFASVLARQPRELVLGMVAGDFSQDQLRVVSQTSSGGNRGEGGSDAPSPSNRADASLEFDPYNRARFDGDSGGGPSSLSPLTSVFIAPGLSPRKHSNPSVRLFYLQTEEVTKADTSASGNANDTSSSSSDSLDGLSSLLKPLHGILPPLPPLSSSSSRASGTAPLRAVSLRDYSQWYLPLHYANGASRAGVPWSWQYHYSFAPSFRVPDATPASVASVADNLARNPLLMHQYEMHVSVNQPTTQSHTDWLCDMRFLQPEANARCKQTGNVWAP